MLYFESGAVSTAVILRQATRSIVISILSIRFSRAELFVIGAVLLFGGIFVFAIPLGGGWDEETHLIRVWEIASLKFVPNDTPRGELPYPSIFWNLSYRRPVLIRPVETGFWAEFGDLPMDAFGYIYDGSFTTRSVYLPQLLAPQAFGVRYLGHALDLPALQVFYASRLLGLVTYAFLAWLAVRIAPFGNWIVAVVAASPTALFQAATVSADPISNALGLLFVFGSLAISIRNEIRWREWTGLVVLAFTLFWAKPNLAILALLPFLIIPRSRFAMKKGYLLLALAVFTLGVIEVGGWAAIAYPQLESTAGGANPAGQLLYLVTHPLKFVEIVVSDLLAHGGAYLRQWIAEFGYEYWSIPPVTYVVYFLALLAALFADAGGPKPTSRTRRGLAALFLIGIVGTILSLYLADNPVGSPAVHGVQGRYFGAIFPLLLLALVGWLPARRPQQLENIASIFAAGSLTVYLVGLGLSYYVLCGSAWYGNWLCTQPVYKNYDPGIRYSPALVPGMTLTQEIVPECAGVSQVRVWINTSDGSNEGQTELLLRDPSTNEILAQSSFLVSALPIDGWQSLDFETDWDSVGKRYELEVRGTGVAYTRGPRISYTQRPEYAPGMLYLDGTPIDEDLLFRYTCLAGPLTILRQSKGATN
ncbi:MAG: DUF2142 domain-containing protein [Anaerolineales bacterium]